MTKKINPALTKTQALILAWKKRKDYLGENKKSSLYTSWRSRLFTKKGKQQGFPISWNTFIGFKNDIPDGWAEGKILVRKNSKLPFSKDNCEWVEKGLENIGRLITLTYNNQTKTLIEWAKEYNLFYNGIRQRYFKGKNYSPEQILFGKKYSPRSNKSDHKTLGFQERRDKISKMLSAYRQKDKVRGREFKLDSKWFEDNILTKPCSYCGSMDNVGCDRIDNKKGHTYDNVIPACYICNITRHDNFSVNEMRKIGLVIKEIMNSRSIVDDNIA